LLQTFVNESQKAILNCGVSLKDHIVRPTNMVIFLA